MPSLTSPGFVWVGDARSIKTLRKRGRLYRGKSVFAWISRNEAGGPDGPRVGVVTGRGFVLATRRNLARRRVRGCIMDLRRFLEEGYSYLVECRPGSEEVNYQLLVIEVRGILSRAEVTEKKETAGSG